MRRVDSRQSLKSSGRPILVSMSDRKLAFIYSPEIEGLTYPPECPFKTQRVGLTRQRLLRHESRIDALRKTIDLVDQNIVLLLAERQALVRQIGDLKKTRGKKILDKSREEKILRKQLPVASQLGLDRRFTAKLFRAIFQLARTTQKGTKR